MNPEQAFKNLVIVANRAQKAGLLELAEAVGVAESIEALAKALNVQAEPVLEPAPLNPASLNHCCMHSKFFSSPSSSTFALRSVSATRS